MRYGFVLTVDMGGPGELGWQQRQAFEAVTGTVEELTARLRPWALTALARDNADNGLYHAHLVTLDEDDEYDTYLADAVEDVVWFFELEHVPVGTASAR